MKRALIAVLGTALLGATSTLALPNEENTRTVRNTSTPVATNATTAGIATRNASSTEARNMVPRAHQRRGTCSDSAYPAPPPGVDDTSSPGGRWSVAITQFSHAEPAP